EAGHSGKFYIKDQAIRRHHRFHVDDGFRRFVQLGVVSCRVQDSLDSLPHAGVVLHNDDFQVSTWHISSLLSTGGKWPSEQSAMGQFGAHKALRKSSIGAGAIALWCR